MNVLLANSTCKIGGVSTFLLALRRALVAQGHTCELFFFEHGAMDAHLPADCPVHYGSLADLLRLVADRDIDVVHANNIDWPTGISAVRQLGARLVLTAHKVREEAWTWGWRQTNCDALVAVSSWIRKDLQSHTDVPIETVHNGIDTTLFHPGAAVDHLEAGSAPIVAWVGRAAAPRKRLELFAAATPALRRAGFRIWVIDQQGPETFAEAFPAEVQLLTASVERWQGAPYAEMPAVYRAVAASGGCVVSTASSEGLPLTLLEAQACAAPVIAASANGVDECVSVDHGGILFNSARDDLAAVITDTLRDTDRMRRMQQQAADHVAATFSLSRMAARYLDIYTRARPQVRPLTLPGRAYATLYLGVGYRQFDAAMALAAAGAARPAAAAARAALFTAPTMFARPSRLRQLARILLSEHSGMTMKQLSNWLSVAPREKTPKPCGTDDILDGRKPAQMGWYAFAAGLVKDQSVLDVGCGSGEGLKLLAAQARHATGIDLDERLRRPDLDVQIKSIADMPDKSYDCVVCLDVIEHVTDDKDFLDQLFRVARKAVFVSTPNFTMSRNRHPYHVREYTPAEFASLFDTRGALTLYGGSAHGHEQAEIARRPSYFLVNALYTWKPTLLAAKVLKRVLGVRVWKHNAALVRLRDEGAEAPSSAAAA